MYGEDLLTVEGSEYRSWDPYRSKLAAAIVKGISPDLLKPGQKVLYLGVSTGTTASHVSDVLGETGLLIGVELSARVGREFLEKVARERKNVIPFIADARDVERFARFGNVDCVYCDIAQRDQTAIAIANCRRTLRPGGMLILVVKARSIDALKDPKLIFREEEQKLKEEGFEIERLVDLKPFDRDHALIVARMMMAERKK